MKRILTILILLIASVYLFGQNQIQVRNATITNNLKYKGTDVNNIADSAWMVNDTLFVTYVFGDTDTIPLGGASLWYNNGGITTNSDEQPVTIDSTLFLTDSTTNLRLGFGLGWERTTGKVFVYRIGDLGDSIDAERAAIPTAYTTWTRDTSSSTYPFVYLANCCDDRVLIGATDSATGTSTLDVAGEIWASQKLQIGGYRDAPDTALFVDAIDSKTILFSKVDSNRFVGFVKFDSIVEHGDWIKTDYITGSGLDEYGEPMNENNIMLGNGAFVKDARAGDTAIYSIFHGYNAGYDADTIFSSVFIGIQAGETALDVNNSTFLGYAGYGASDVSYSAFIGDASGENSSNIISSYFIGNNAGQTSTNDTSCYFIGNNAGSNSDNNKGSFFIGENSGSLSDGVKNSLFIGAYTGVGSSDVENSIFIGDSAGYGQTTISNQLWIDNSSTSNPLIWGDFATDSLRVNGNQHTAGYVTQESAYHIFGFFGDSTVNYTFDVQNTWYQLTNVGKSLWAWPELDGWTESGDTLICVRAGDWDIFGVFNQEGSNGQEYNIRFFNTTTTLGIPVGSGEAGAGADAFSIIVSAYAEDLNVGDKIIIQARNADGTGALTLRSSSIKFQYLHD